MIKRKSEDGSTSLSHRWKSKKNDDETRDFYREVVSVIDDFSRNTKSMVLTYQTDTTGKVTKIELSV